MGRRGFLTANDIFIDFNPAIPLPRDKVLDMFPHVDVVRDDHVYDGRIEINQVVTVTGTSRGIPVISTIRETTTLHGPAVPATAPAITATPAGGSVTADTAVELTAGLTGSEPLSYEWRRNGTALPGATTATLTLSSAQTFDTGEYILEISNALGSVTSAPITLTVNAAPPSAARLLNLSTRGLSLRGDQQLIPGFVIAGTGTQQLLLRAVGPTLAGHAVPDVLADPVMTLQRYDPATSSYFPVLTVDDWGASANRDEIIATSARLGAFALPDDSKDAALLTELAPGQYTIVVSGQDGGTGNAIVELYDAEETAAAARLANISNRGYVGSGDSIMIPGFVISHEGPRTVLVRAVGPSLSSSGVTDLLAEPEITIHRRDPDTNTDAAILHNNDWDGLAGSATTAAIAGQVGAFPLASGSKDAAFVVTLNPGTYTAIARGADGTTGVALVEVYLGP